MTELFPFCRRHAGHVPAPRCAAFIAALVLAASTALPAQTRAQGLTIDGVIRDTSLASEAVPLAARFAWQRSPQVVQYAPQGAILPPWWPGARPQWCYEALSWYTAFEAEGNGARNARVQVRGLRIYLLSNKSKAWRLADLAEAPATDLWVYPFDYAGDAVAAGARREADGGYAIKPAYPNFHHGYGKTIVLDDPADVRAVFVAMDFRLVRDDPFGPDDLDKARYVVDAGADYYPGKGKTWGVGYAPGVGNGRYLLASRRWRTATLLVPNRALGTTFDEIRRNPPPLSLSMLAGK